MSIPTPSTRLAGKTILVTGAAGGIGEAYARHLAAAGAAVAIADLDLDAARETAERLSAGGARTTAVRIDVREPASIAAAFDACEAALGSVDVLVNNAGVCIREPFLTITEDQFRLMHEVNARGALLCTQEFARRAIDAGRGGKVINTCSTSSRQASADFAAYAASKAATLSVTHSSARALAPHGITVNGIAPGIVDTGLWSRVSRDADGAEQPMENPVDLDGYLAQIPLGRVAQVDDIAPTAVFLASADADYMTGQMLLVDGGMVIQ